MFLKKYFKYGLILCLSIFIIGSPFRHLFAQNKTLIKKEYFTKQAHSPHKATIRSMVIPGWGQAYNKKYWKIPIIYAGFGAMIYLINQNNSEYKKFKTAYDYTQLPEDTSIPSNPLLPPNEYAEKYNSEQLKNARDIYRRNLDFSYIITGLWYVLNIVDASVDAHLFEFEVNDDLSLKIEPDIKILPREYKTYTGLKVSFKLPITSH